MSETSKTLGKFVRQVRGGPRPTHICSACGVLLGPEELCDLHVEGERLQLAGWRRAATTRVPTRPPPAGKIRLFLRIVSPILAASLWGAAKLNRFERGDGMTAVYYSIIALVVTLLVWLVPTGRRTKRESRRRVTEDPAPKHAFAGTLVSSDGSDKWIGYRIEVSPVPELTPMEAWIEPCVVELDDGREVELSGGRARVRGAERQPVEPELMDAFTSAWGVVDGSMRGHFHMLSAGDRVTLHNVPREAPPEELFRGQARYVVEGVPDLTPHAGPVD